MALVYTDTTLCGAGGTRGQVGNCPCRYNLIRSKIGSIKRSCTKGGFFSESAIRFSNLPISSKKIFQKTILTLKFKIPTHNIILLWTGILNFKFRMVLWNILIWRMGDLKNESHFLISEKSHLKNTPDLKSGTLRCQINESTRLSLSWSKSSSNL